MAASPNFTIRQIVLTHEPSGQGSVTSPKCFCGRLFTGEHLLDELETAGYNTTGVTA
jgi:hypothetical protein